MKVYQTCYKLIRKRNINIDIIKFDIHNYFLIQQTISIYFATIYARFWNLNIFLSLNTIALTSFITILHNE